MHGVFAISKLILSSRKWASVNHALLGRIHQSFTLPTVTVSIDSPLTRSTNEVTSILIVGVVHLWSTLESLAACLKASTFSR